MYIPTTFQRKKITWQRVELTQIGYQKTELCLFNFRIHTAGTEAA